VSSVASAHGFWHRPAMRWSWSVPLVGLLSLVSAGSCPDGFTCECQPCGAAVSLTVVDEDLVAFGGDWAVEASLDGVPVDTSACDPVARQGSNACGFGFETGVYQFVLRTPTGEKSAVARFAGRAGADCCNQCLLGDSIQLVAP